MPTLLEAAAGADRGHRDRLLRHERAPAFIYVRGEVLHVIRRLRFAVAEAYEAGFLGANILGFRV